MRTISTLLVLAALVGCGDEAKPAAKPADKREEAAKPAEPPKAAPAPDKPWSSKDAKGHDWAAQMGDIQFDTDWQAAMKRSKASKVPLMFLFTEKKSADAEKMAAAAFKDPKVVEASKAFVVALVDAEENAPLAEEYNARTTPMVVFASSTGNILGEAISAADMLKEMQTALATLKEDEAGDK